VLAGDPSTGVTRNDRLNDDDSRFGGKRYRSPPRKPAEVKVAASAPGNAPIATKTRTVPFAVEPIGLVPVYLY